MTTNDSVLSAESAVTGSKASWRELITAVYLGEESPADWHVRVATCPSASSSTVRNSTTAWSRGVCETCTHVDEGVDERDA